jgi:hypothetical protein
VKYGVLFVKIVDGKKISPKVLGLICKKLRVAGSIYAK